MPQPLLEGVRGAVPFIVDRSQPFLTETRNGKTFSRIPGRFSICDSVNGNNRRYPKKVWEKNLAEGSQLKQAIAKNAAFGLLEHPSSGQISLQSPICIAVTDARLQQGKDAKGNTVDEVVGEITVLNTAEGQKLSALIEFGYNPLVSSRGFGSIVKTSDGIDEVQDDYVCEGWDPVLKPSFETAELWPDRTSQEAKLPVKEAVITEHNEIPTAATPVVAETNLKAASPPSKTEAAAPAASAEPKLTNKAMTINEIKSRIGMLGATKVPTDPARFAEGMNEMAQLHQEVADYVAEDAKRSWQGQQLHEAVKVMEKTWSESALAPAKQAVKLTESYHKVLKVTKAIGETAVGLKRQLSETVKQNSEATQLVEELTVRGQAWVTHANKLKAQITTLESKLAENSVALDTTCEALDIISERYEEDMASLGKRVITLEFAEQAKTEEIAKLLKEAKTPKDVIAIREKLQPSKKAEAPKSAAAPKQESAPNTEPPKTPESSTPMVEAYVLVPSVRSVTESVEMAKRLSASAK